MSEITLAEFVKLHYSEVMELQAEHKILFGSYYAPFDWESSTVGPQAWLEEFKRTVEEGRAKRQSASEK